MTQQGPLHWLDGEGWIILSGGGQWQRGETDIVDAQILSVANLDRPMVVIVSDGDQTEAEGLLEHYMLLGGPTGEAFALKDMTRQQFQDPGIVSLIAEAGILYIGGGQPLNLVQALWNTPLLRQIVHSFSTFQGLMVVGDGEGAAALGTWFTNPQNRQQLNPGLNFLHNIIAIPHFTSTEETLDIREALKARPGHLALGIPNGMALALGPQGQVESWGTGQITAIVHTNGEAES
ncbi:MAG: Type 1 glutamine amidotransferase-like domain-containing protein [Anaerolineae bacterium]|nr:Type 1 glutamine amidotransferase-like domain-containing protein [Anaerolineae bacterium]